MLNAVFEYPFLQNALWASLLASIVCGMIGVIIVEKKLLMMSGGIAHTALGGVGLGYLLGFPPILGAGGFSIVAAFGIGYLKRKWSEESDVVIALFWSLGMALGIGFIALMKGYPPDLNSYLFGNILTVSKGDLRLMLIMSTIISAIILTFFNDWKCWMFDPEFSKIRGLKIAFLEYLLLIMAALTVVVLIRVAGIILVIALLSAPAAVAGKLTSKLSLRMVYATFFSLFFCIAGLTLSFYFNIPSGASIIVLSVATYTGILFLSRSIFILKTKQKNHKKRMTIKHL